MTLAKRVRDCRYAKGWGPDELASRAAISRTALYQIECGKTETPRAGTLRRIAEALEIPIDALIAEDVDPSLLIASAAKDSNTLTAAPSRLPEEARYADPVEERPYSSLEALDILSEDSMSRFRSTRLQTRQHELERKFHELLASPLGEGMARIIEESHRMLPLWHSRR
jgi:transcriptional regulator with XRE-family HTH domain